MKATISPGGQITIPQRLLEKFGLHPGDELEFDENGMVLTVRHAVSAPEWESIMMEWQSASELALRQHPWRDQASACIIDDLRGGPAEAHLPLP
jgi:AbrB family looped-hinge helix DNA binding protein